MACNWKEKEVRELTKEELRDYLVNTGILGRGDANELEG
jgi:hypothetical protein